MDKNALLKAALNATERIEAEQIASHKKTHGIKFVKINNEVQVSIPENMTYTVYSKIKEKNIETIDEFKNGSDKVLVI